MLAALLPEYASHPSNLQDLSALNSQISVDISNQAWFSSNSPPPAPRYPQTFAGSLPQHCSFRLALSRK